MLTFVIVFAVFILGVLVGSVAQRDHEAGRPW